MDKSETKEPKINKQADVFLLEDDLVVINDTQYRLIENHDNGFDKEKIEERYNNVLDKYDYIVGDWGYDQLRFKGFYIDKRIESNLDNKISHLEDYLLEYCNFGCAYFILERVDKLPLTKPKHHRQKPKNAAHANGKNNHNVHGKNGHNMHNKKQNSSHRTHQTQNKHATASNKPEHESKKSTNNKHPRIRRRRSENTNAAPKKHRNNSAKPRKTNTKSGSKTFKIRKIDK
ncbi:YutD family protein [Companilactobacillus sp.]|uniref:YutD family protein n=1 Tax=Companilactobacillus sp. TaxID=2767905 RepID=UPI0025B9120C|nr:YutD family protein [Companilactobacillus sp.]MCH4010324.1 YutD family protein [Companilactobacillus sp.]MCH4052000.1 YutD family protein [Companilactobacillus sp.]MCH4078266.1 YutD family protein [Companilactobacillus sp.]MCH4126842.1 YutD family protein [Companilactobacillus sp.]MCH4132681.1 YutD family protein [Companilactobacillus sp.]